MNKFMITDGFSAKENSYNEKLLKVKGLFLPRGGQKSLSAAKTIIFYSQTHSSWVLGVFVWQYVVRCHDFKLLFR